jgi:hypothetical protein
MMFSFHFTVALPADAEHHRIGEEFDRHFPTANGHHLSFHEEELNSEIQTNKQLNGRLTQHVFCC